MIKKEKTKKNNNLRMIKGRLIRIFFLKAKQGRLIRILQYGEIIPCIIHVYIQANPKKTLVFLRLPLSFDYKAKALAKSVTYGI